MRSRSAAVASDGSGGTGIFPARVRNSAAIATGSVAAIVAGRLSSGSAASAMRTPSIGGRRDAAGSHSSSREKARTRPSPSCSAMAARVRPPPAKPSHNSAIVPS